MTENIGKILEQKNDESEPVLPCVASVDAEITGIAADRLRSLIERIERLECEKKDILRDIRDIYAEAKSAGFDVKVMKMVVRLRRQNADERDFEDQILETYRKALDL